MGIDSDILAKAEIAVAQAYFKNKQGVYLFPEIAMAVIKALYTPPALTEEQRLQMLCVLANGIRSCEFANLAWEQAKTGFDTLRAAGYTISFTGKPSEETTK